MPIERVRELDRKLKDAAKEFPEKVIKEYMEDLAKKGIGSDKLDKSNKETMDGAVKEIADCYLENEVTIVRSFFSIIVVVVHVFVGL